METNKEPQITRLSGKDGRTLVIEENTYTLRDKENNAWTGVIENAELDPEGARETTEQISEWLVGGDLPEEAEEEIIEESD